MLRDIAETIWPAPGDRHGPLATILISLTVATGLVDAVSYIKLGHVFVANMTGNVVFLGFALAGAKGLSISASLMALGSFLVGAVAGGRLGALVAEHRGRVLRAAVSVEAVLVLAALAVGLLGSDPVTSAGQYTLIGLLALAMGVQNSAARRVGVPDLTTTVVTLTLTGVAADSRAAGGPGSKAGRRLVVVGAMFLGALAGGLLAVHISIAAPLAVASALLAFTALGTWRISRSAAAWTRPALLTAAQGGC